MEKRFLVLLKREHTDGFGSKGAIQVYGPSQFFQTYDDAHKTVREAALKYEACTFYVGEALESIQIAARPMTVTDLRKL